MKILYIVVLVLFLLLCILYIFMSIRLNVLSKKKEQIVRGFMKPDQLQIVDDYRKSTRVTLREIFLGLDNGKASKK